MDARQDQAPEGITPVVEDYLKVIWSATEWGGPPATVSSLADRFGSTRPTVSATLRRLADRGLLDHERYGRTSLTERGTRLAVAMVRRHRLIETYLVEHLGYGWDDVHEEAERLEHAVSDTFVDRIDALLGHPDTDPHGDPIPASDGTVRYPDDAGSLDDAAPGRYRVVRVSDARAARLRHFADLGIAPGALVEVPPPHEPRRVTVGDGRMLASEDEQAIIVRPASPRTPPRPSRS
jgi:DtxR family Mn-dependent transcriptional regulator